VSRSKPVQFGAVGAYEDAQSCAAKVDHFESNSTAPAKISQDSKIAMIAGR